MTWNQPSPPARPTAPPSERLRFGLEKFTFWHGPSLRRPHWRSSPVEIKLWHYPKEGYLTTCKLLVT